VGFRLHDGAVEWLKGWALALVGNEAARRKAVERARRFRLCRD
jgi:hypothetical protein